MGGGSGGGEEPPWATRHLLAAVLDLNNDSPRASSVSRGALAQRINFLRKLTSRFSLVWSCGPPGLGARPAEGEGEGGADISVGRGAGAA